MVPVNVPNIVGAALLVLLPAADAFGCTKTVRWFDDPPYTFLGRDGQVAGIDADLARDTLRVAGCDVKFVHMPWARALIELERGKLDILPGALRTPERERFALFSIPLPKSPNVLYLSAAAAKTYKLSSLDDLIGTPFRLGAQVGVSYGGKFDQFKENPAARANLVPVTLRCSAWQMLALGRLDGLIADEATAVAELEQLGLTGIIKPSPVTVSIDTAMFAFSKASTAPGFVVEFNKELSKRIANGAYRQGRERYTGDAAGLNACGARPVR